MGAHQALPNPIFPTSPTLMLTLRFFQRSHPNAHVRVHALTHLFSGRYVHSAVCYAHVHAHKGVTLKVTRTLTNQHISALCWICSFHIVSSVSRKSSSISTYTRSALPGMPY